MKEPFKKTGAGSQDPKNLLPQAAAAEKKLEFARKKSNRAKMAFKQARKEFKQAKKAAKHARKLAKAATKALKSRPQRARKKVGTTNVKKRMVVEPSPVSAASAAA